MKLPAARHVQELIVQKSRFIGVLDRVRDREELIALVDDCRVNYPNARHYCFAFNAGEPGSSRLVGHSDDGEPHGTAGQPMLNVLMHADVGEVGIVVVRYFGGIKLGKGGLARAYADTVKAVLDTAPVAEVVPMQEIPLTLSYAQAARVMNWVESAKVEVVNQQFAANVEVTLRVPEQKVSELTDVLQQMGVFQ
ncbi:MAG: YigZ family protein [Natronospirillum sp.]